MQLTMLGTGNALVTKCYNTCFVLSCGERRLLVDAGGGNGVLTQLERAGIPLDGIHEMFVTHKHIDHLLGAVWVVRIVATHMAKGSFIGDFSIFGHDEVIGLLRDMCENLLAAKQRAMLDGRIRFVVVEDAQEICLLGRAVTVFDIASTKAKQFGFSMDMDGVHRLVCCGDEPVSDAGRAYAKGATWLLHEAFCLSAEADIHHPYEKHHSTAADAAALAEELGVRHLVLYHTEDTDLAHRAARYGAEASSVYSGDVNVPADLETIDLVC